MMHALFSVFDKEVKRRGLFKMDTVGDAYICAGIVNAAARPAGQVCEDVLAVAGAMLRTVDVYRTEGDAQVQCRIGVAAGSVVAGSLGRLQPRLHIFGPGLRAAELCEQTGREGAVHASRSFVEALWGGDCSWDSPGARCPLKEDTLVTACTVAPVVEMSPAELSSPCIYCTTGSDQPLVSNRELERSSQRCKAGHVVWADLRGEGEEDPAAFGDKHDEIEVCGGRRFALAGWVVTEWTPDHGEKSASVTAVDESAISSHRQLNHPQELVGSYLLVPEQRRRGFSVDFPYAHQLDDRTLVEPLQKGSPFGIGRYCGPNGLPAVWAARVKRSVQAGPKLPTWANDPMSEQVFYDLNSKQAKLRQESHSVVCSVCPLVRSQSDAEDENDVKVCDDVLWAVNRRS
jgi:hypothetical protein